MTPAEFRRLPPLRRMRITDEVLPCQRGPAFVRALAHTANAAEAADIRAMQEYAAQEIHTLGPRGALEVIACVGAWLMEHQEVLK